jgi:uncharacterized Zn finger protein
VGLDLLPGPGEVQPRCSCPDWADPCKHAAAVCYLVADELDRDPFLLFLLRGKGRDELLAGVRQRRFRVHTGNRDILRVNCTPDGEGGRNFFFLSASASPELLDALVGELRSQMGV